MDSSHYFQLEPRPFNTPLYLTFRYLSSHSIANSFTARCKYNAGNLISSFSFQNGQPLDGILIRIINMPTSRSKTNVFLRQPSSGPFAGFLFYMCLVDARRLLPCVFPRASSTRSRAPNHCGHIDLFGTCF
jgi:hypothetical protein